MQLDTTDLDAVVFDMDGVVSDTASLHERAWKQLFDHYLGDREPTTAALAPFGGDDYRRYVDGRARVDGVVAFLASRGIELPLGSPADPATRESVWGLANHKNALFHRAIDEFGVTVFDGTIALVEQLRRRGVRTALVTASRNAAEILAAGGVGGLFDARVDGLDLEDRHLPGKPDPASFLEAARRLGVEPARTAIVEDSAAGVEAGRRGGFALVIGVDRTGSGDMLRAHGAHAVVRDLAEITLGSRPAPGVRRA